MDSLDASRLEAEYEAEVVRARRAVEKGEDAPAPASGGKRKGREEVKVEMMPTLDGRGKLYDVGLGGKAEAPLLPGNRRKVEKVSTLGSRIDLGKREADRFGLVLVHSSPVRNSRSQDRRPSSSQRRRRYHHPRRARSRGEVRSWTSGYEEHGC